MGRPRRIKFYDEEVFYHTMSKTAGDYFLLKKKESKKKFLEILFNLLKAFSFKLEAYTIMNNHFHLLIKSIKISKFSDDEILRKAKEAKIYKKLTFLKDTYTLRKRLADISEFMKLLKEKFSKWYNKKNKRTGYLWGQRFKSVVLEDGLAVLVCKKYIEYNPVIAKIVKNPEEYKFSSCYNGRKTFDEKDLLINKSDVSVNIHEINETIFERGTIIGSKSFLNKIHTLFKKKFNLKGKKNFKKFTEKLFIFTCIKNT